MARVTVLPESDTLGTVDVKELLKDRGELPPIDSTTHVPSSLRSFVVNQDPKMVVVPQFLSPGECAHLMELADGNWIRSLVGQLVTGKEADKSDDKVQTASVSSRTSSSSPLRPSQTAIMQRIEQRLAQLAGLPVDQLERLVVVRYAPGQQFTEHHDGKFRPITVFIYLNELQEGDEGSTHFPHLGLQFVPREGCAVMWPNAQPDGSEDSRMIHAGRPPLKGIKYGVNCFFNKDHKRQVFTPDSKTLSVEDAYQIDVATLGGGSTEPQPSNVVKTFKFDTEPQIQAVRSFFSHEEADTLLALLGSDGGADEDANNGIITPSDSFFKGSTVILKRLRYAETEAVEKMEARIAHFGSVGVEKVGQLRIVNGGTKLGLCNRGNSQRSLVVCLSESDEVFFPYLGVRILIRKGDLLEWPNAWYQEPCRTDSSQVVTVEDLRTQRVHLCKEGVERSICLETGFHDQAIRGKAS
eukprot:TRINITY_DN22743_c0_g1_i1.p1 TRINITY_DN22743_c0_g1~~TRINITY_DN22743_c0_g1_i1.p1  ORF type:complete len:468 (-),score=56.99 TRINITY_DN22743_c0_g1_i1:79-1482(-)